MKAFFRWVMEQFLQSRSARLRRRLLSYQGNGGLAWVQVLESREVAPSRRSRRFSFSRVLEPLEDRITPTGNIAVISVTLVDGHGNPLASVNAGEDVSVQVEYTATNLPANASYNISYDFNGFTQDIKQVTSGAGATGTGYYWWTLSSSSFVVAPGANQITVTVDPDQSVADTNEADNSMTTTVNGALPTEGSLTFSASQVRFAYGLNSLPEFGTAAADGTGQTIAIVDAYNDPTIFSDLDEFDQSMNLSTNTSPTLYQAYGAAASDLTVYNQSGVNISSQIANSGQGSVPPVDPTGGWEGEVALDVEWAHAIAPGAHIDLIENDDASGLDQAAAMAASLPGVSVVSMSWGGGESAGETADDSSTYVTPTGHTGVTFLSSAGDGGTPSSYPSFSPNVIAVGGTDLITSGDGYGSETAWSFPTPSAIDNGSGSYSQTGTWAAQAGGFSGTYSTASAGSNSSANWTTSISSSDQGAGEGTEVSATWVAAVGNATNATYSIFDGSSTAGKLLGTVTVNQTISPAGTTNGSTQFQELGVYNPSSGQMTVVLNATSANGTVSADAIGIAPASATGGGQSLYETEPSYQSSVQNSGYRTVPDVSFVRGTVNTFNGGSGGLGGGTSLSCPCWAGIIAIVDQGRVAAGGSPLDSSTDPTQALQAIYAIPSTDFHDITTGYNGLFAGPGYDELTGRGSPIANLLIPDIVAYDLGVAPAVTAPTAVSVNQGGTLAFASGIAISVKDPSGTAEQLTLSVSDGTLSLGTTTGVSVTGSGTASITITGTLTSLNSDLTTLSYTPTLGYHGSDTLSLSDTDTTDSLTGTASVVITVNPPATTSMQITAGNVAYSGQAYSATATVTANGNAVSSPTVTYTYYYATDTAFANPISVPTHVGNYVVVANYAGSQLYSPSQAQASFSITQVNITLTIGNDQQTYGTTANLVSNLGATINTGINGENLGIIYSSSGDTKTAHVGTYGITGVLSDGTGLLSDYNVTLNNGTLAVGKDAVTLTIGNDTQTYGTPSNLGSDLGSTINTGVNSQSFGIVYSSTGDTGSAHVGTYAITGVLSDGTGLLSDYNVTLKNGTLAVGKDTVTLTIGNDTQTYGTPANLGNDLGATIATGVNSQNLGIVYSSTGDTNTAHVGAYSIAGVVSDGTGLLSDYNVTLKNGALAVGKDTVTLTIGNDTQTYGTPSNLGSDLGATINTGVNSQNFGIVYSSTGDTNTAHVGAYAITGVLSDGSGLLSDYNVTLKNGTLAVGKDSVTLTIGNDTQTYGTPANLGSDLGSTINTGVNSQNFGVVYSSAGDTNTSHVGTYAITGVLSDGSGQLSDYNVTLKNGTLAVGKDSVTLTIGNDTQTYATPANFGNDLGATIATGVNSQNLGIVYSSTGDTSTAHVGTYAITGVLSDGSGLLSDYTVTLKNGTLAVGKDNVTLTIGNDTQTYGTPANLGNDLGSTVNTGVNSQNFGIVYSSAGDTSTAHVGTYAITGMLSDGTGLLSDYNVTLNNGTLAVGKASITLTIGNDVQTYGSPANLGSDLGSTINTGVNSQNFDIVYSSTGDTNAAAVGQYAITGVLSNGTGQLTDYNVTLNGGTLTINEAHPPTLPGGVTVAKSLVSIGVFYDLDSLGNLYSWTSPAATWTPLDSGVTNIAFAGNGDVVDLHGDGGLFEFTDGSSASSRMKLDVGVSSFAIAGNGDVIDYSNNGLYEFTAFRNASSLMKLDNSVEKFAIAGNGDVVDFSNGELYEFTSYRNASSLMKLDNSVSSFAIAGNGDVVDYSNGGLYEFTAYRNASSLMKLDNSVTSFAIAGNGDVMDLSNGGLYEFTAYRSASSEMRIDSGVHSFAVAGNGDVVALHGDGGLYEFTAYRSASSELKIDVGVSSIAIAGNGDVVDYSNGGLYEFTAFRNASSLMKLDNSVTSFAIADNGDVMDLSNGGLYEFTAFRNTSSVTKIDAGVASIAIAGNGDVVYLQSDGGLSEYCTSQSVVQIDAGVTEFQIANNGLVEDERSSGNQYIQTITNGPVAQPISQFS